MFIFDESGAAKQGKHSVAVARQYSGTLGNVGNCQVGVYLAYASPRGHALLDDDLYLPKEWADDPMRCAAADVPKSVQFQTKGDLALALLQRTQKAGHLQGHWVTGDSVYGSDPGLRDGLARAKFYYVLEVRQNEPVFTGDQTLPCPSGRARGANRTVSGWWLAALHLR